MRINLTEMKSRKKIMGLTFQDISERSGVPKRTIEDIFAQRTVSPRIDTIEAIEEALQIKQEPKTWKPTTRRVPYGLKTYKPSKASTLLAQLTKEEQDEVVKYMEYLISKRK